MPYRPTIRKWGGWGIEEETPIIHYTVELMSGARPIFFFFLSVQNSPSAPITFNDRKKKWEGGGGGGKKTAVSRHVRARREKVRKKRGKPCSDKNLKKLGV